jgi:very-short-patch-repair endonuclease
MRREPTDAEARLWHYLRNRQVAGAKFRQQHPLLGYCVDFCCDDAKLIVEADGGQHDRDTDADRTTALEAAGYTVLRFWNHDILANTEGVIAEIRQMLSPTDDGMNFPR